MATRSPRRYTVAAAKDRLPALLHEAEGGEAIEITRHGKPVAVIVSVEAYRRLQGERPDLWQAYQAWREVAAALTDEDVDALADPDRAREPGHGIDW